MIRFEWDSRKDLLNEKKHGISFREAETVFRDENAIEFDDPDHSIYEQRFVLLGLSVAPRLLVVSYCFRGPELRIRIISARSATRNEHEAYARGQKQ